MINLTEYSYHGNHKFLSYVYTYKTAKECLRRAQEDKEGSFYLYLSCLTFCSFTVEAYLNHLGEAELSIWDSSDRMSLDEKIDKLRTRGIQIDKGSAIYQKLKLLYNFRNRIAHGKTKSVDFVAENVRQISDMHEPAERQFWGIEISEEVCASALSYLEKFVMEIDKKAGGNGRPFSSLGGGHGARRYKSNSN